jgi:DNA-binding CsgD family transcriptional regulator
VSNVEWRGEKLPIVKEDLSTSTGILLLTSSLDTVAYNREALQILTFPNDPKRLKHLASFLAGRIRRKIATRSFIEGQQFVGEFRSGNRTYQFRALTLRPAQVTTGKANASIALLLERPPSAALSLKRRTWKEFELTRRERQTIELLLQGMTTKTIAQSLNVSPSTVKSHLRQIMTKMRVSTRTGIIGKIIAT